MLQVALLPPRCFDPGSEEVPIVPFCSGNRTEGLIVEMKLEYNNKERDGFGAPVFRFQNARN